MTPNPTPTPLASTAMEAARAIYTKTGLHKLYPGVESVVLELLAGTMSEHFQPLLAKVEGETEQTYDADRAEVAANLWNQLAQFEGEDADAQLIIESALIDHTSKIDAELNEASECIVERDNKVVELSAELTALRADLAAAKEELAAFVDHHEITEQIIRDAQGQRPETGKALLYTLDTLKADLAAKEAEIDRCQAIVRKYNAGIMQDRLNVERLEAVRLAALRDVAFHVRAIPEVETQNGRIEHAFVLSAHRILPTGEPDGVLKTASVNSALASRADKGGAS